MFPKISKTIELQCLFCLITALYIFDLMDIKQNTAAVSGEGREADHLQIGINLRTVIGKLQCLPLQRSSLIAVQPFHIHVAEQAAKGAADQFIEGHLFDSCQCFISITEDPVNRMPLLIKDHFNVSESKGHMIKAPIIAVVGISGSRRFPVTEGADHILLQPVKLLYDLLFPALCKFQRLPVIQIYSVCNIMDDPHSHKASSVYPDKALRKLLCKLRDGNSCFVHLISQNMNLRIPSIHQNIQNPGSEARDPAV